jgi:Pentapeptide repeats (8 copies)
MCEDQLVRSSGSEVLRAAQRETEQSRPSKDLHRAPTTSYGDAILLQAYEYTGCGIGDGRSAVPCWDAPARVTHTRALRFSKMVVAEYFLNDTGGPTMGLRKLKSIKHNGKRLSDILEAHQLFFSGKDGGTRADLSGADLSRADLSGVNLSGAILRQANFSEADLRKARLPGADLSGANLHKADLRNADLTEAILPGANLSEAQASGIEFFRCDLSNANFERAQLRNVNFRLANLAGVKLAGADLGVAILRETDLQGVDLSGVDLSTTLLPKGFVPPQGSQAKQKTA